IFSPTTKRYSYPSAIPTGRSAKSLNSSPAVLKLTAVSWLRPRRLPVKVRLVIWSGVIVGDTPEVPNPNIEDASAPPNRLSGTQPAIALLASPGLDTQVGTPLTIILGPSAAARFGLFKLPVFTWVASTRP